MMRIGFESRVFILSSAHHAPCWFAGGSLPGASKATTVEEGEAGRAGWTVEVLKGQRRVTSREGERVVKPGGPIKEHVQPPHQKTIHICSSCPCSYLTANRSVRGEDQSEPERDGTGSPKVFARPQNQRGGRFVDRRFESCRTFTDDKDSKHAMSAPVRDQMGFSCRLWEELGSSLSVLVVLTIQPRHSQYQRPRALAQWPHDQDFYLENQLYCKDLRAGSTQELSSSRKSLPPSPLLLTPLYNIPR